MKENKKRIERSEGRIAKYVTAPSYVADPSSSV
jgi:hypothetical protein